MNKIKEIEKENLLLSNTELVLFLRMVVALIDESNLKGEARKYSNLLLEAIEGDVIREYVKINKENPERIINILSKKMQIISILASCDENKVRTIAKLIRNLN